MEGAPEQSSDTYRIECPPPSAPEDDYDDFRRRKQRRESRRCKAIPVLLCAIMVLLFGIGISYPQCSPCHSCIDGECYVNREHERTTGNVTSCNMFVIFDGEVDSTLTETVLTVDPNCTHAFEYAPADGIVVSCFTDDGSVHFNSTSNMDNYVKQCPEMFSVLIVAALVIVTTIPIVARPINR